MMENSRLRKGKHKVNTPTLKSAKDENLRKIPNFAL